MAVDPVCKMNVDEDTAAASSVFEGKKYLFCNIKCKEKFDHNPHDYLHGNTKLESDMLAAGAVKDVESEKTAIDPVCGMIVNKNKSIKRKINGQTYYFCMETCANTFEAPEKELKRMKRRVNVALTGVLLAAILRVSVYLGLATMSSVVTWAPFGLSGPIGGLLLFIIVTPIQFIGGWGFYTGAYQGLKSKRLNMDLLIAIGTLTAYLYSTFIVILLFVDPAGKIVNLPDKAVYFDVSAIIIAFVLLGKYMEEIIRKRSSDAVRKLLDLRVKNATIIKNGHQVTIPTENIQVNDVIVVKPGEIIPTDGEVVNGSSYVDESMITGESVAVEKIVGSKVIGATINKNGSFEFIALKTGEDTALMQIVKLVEQAQISSAPIQRIADKVAGYFVPAVLGVAVLSALTWMIAGNFSLALLSFIGVLIVSCPCALGIATPAALMVGVGKGAEFGIIIRGGEYIEKAQSLTTIVFDKTGTLTEGKPSITDIIPFYDFSENEIIKIAATAESMSEHPLAEAIIKTASEKNIKHEKPHSFESISGNGVLVKTGKETILLGNIKLMKKFNIKTEIVDTDKIKNMELDSKTTVYLAVQDKLIAVIAVADTINPMAKSAIDELNYLDKEVVMLTGDNENTANAIAKLLGIKNVIANVLPEEKAKVIKDLQNKQKVVAMVGDGINDAPALATADIGIAIGSGSDVAKESGGIILIKNDIRDVVSAIKLSKATMRKIKQNLFWAFFYNILSIPVAAGVLYPFIGTQYIKSMPIIAAASMSLSSLFVITNSATLKFFKIERQ